MNKGFVFSMDAILAIIILILFLLTFAFFSARSLDDPYTLLVLEKQAEDALLVLDKTGVMETLDPIKIEESLNETLIPSRSWNMRMDIYNHSSEMEHLGIFSFGDDYTDVDTVVPAERIFVVYYVNGTEKSVRYYGIARLRIWAE